MVRMICFWPGLPALWYRGDFHHLGIAIAFACLLNLAIIATFAWPLWLGIWTLRVLWLVIAVCVGFAAYHSLSRLDRIQNGRVDDQADSRFLEAQEHYLRGEYFESEAILHRILSRSDSDIESALLLVSIHRRTQRWQSAVRMLDRIDLLDGSAKWAFEMIRERALINKAQSAEIGESQAGQA